jgi:hypothetical protein
MSAALLTLLPTSVLAAFVPLPAINVRLTVGEFVSVAGPGDFLTFDAPPTGHGLPVLSDLFADLKLDFDLADFYAGADGLFALRHGGKTVRMTS